MRQNSEKPWFRSVKNGWYAWVDGKQVSLGVKGEENKKVAQDAFYRLMADGGKKEQPKADVAVEAIVDGFLAAKKGSIKNNTYGFYSYSLEKVSTAFGKKSAGQLKPAEVLRWLNGLEVSQSTRADVARVLITALKWAEAEELISRNPLKAMKRPFGESRGTKAVISEQTHKKLLKAANPALRLLLTLLHETGCRPAELSRLTADDCDFKNGVAVLSQHKTADKTGKPRLIILTPKAIGILREQAKVNPTGPLLKNSTGKPWTKDSIGGALNRTSKMAGVKVIAYGYRHTFATDALANGVPDATVAALLGHSSTAMLHKHYSHLTARADVLRKAASQVR
jgi:integrase